MWHIKLKKTQSQSFVNTFIIFQLSCFVPSHCDLSIINIYLTLSWCIYSLRGEDGRFDLDENLCHQEMCKDGCMNISAHFCPIFIFIEFLGGGGWSCFVGLCFLYQNETVMFRHKNNNLIEIFEKYVWAILTTTSTILHAVHYVVNKCLNVFAFRLLQEEPTKHKLHCLM